MAPARGAVGREKSVIWGSFDMMAAQAATTMGRKSSVRNEEEVEVADMCWENGGGSV